MLGLIKPKPSLAEFHKKQSFRNNLTSSRDHEQFINVHNLCSLFRFKELPPKQLMAQLPASSCWSILMKLDIEAC